eukprot:TRINITY_DN3435_c0_g1_i1.p2 TRINITY_DN3435_c0_g1~~TRINITY_DN3435_c0_g1_i1.p2  ORF type:complete len:110 (-),score=13.85 TRINITY_DN3435_c0_g1_i1:69-398(-)
MSTNTIRGEQVASYAMALFVSVGGTMGFVKRNSVPSLVAGVSCGALYAVSGYLLQKGMVKEGSGLGFGVSALLSAGMIHRGLETNKKLPLVIAGLSTVTGLYHLLNLSK